MKKGKTIVVHPPLELRKRVDAYCQESGMFLAELCRRAISEYLSARETPKELADGRKRR